MRGAALCATSREKCRGKIKFTTRDRRAICSTARRGGGRGGEERNERTNERTEDESGGWFGSVSGCVEWFAARETKGWSEGGREE